MSQSQYPALLGVSLGLLFGILCVGLAVLVCWLWKRYHCGRTSEKVSGSGRGHGAVAFPEAGLGQYHGQRLLLMQPTLHNQNRASQSCLQPLKLPTVQAARLHRSADDCKDIQEDDVSLPSPAENFSLTSLESDYGTVIPDIYHRERFRGSLGSCSVSSSVGGLSETQSSGGCTNAAATVLGRLRFQLAFDFNTSDLVVLLIEARDLPTCDPQKGFVDPFITLELEPGVDNRQRQTSLQRKTQNPTFNETFKFPVAYEQLQGHTLFFVLHDYDKFSRHNPVGEVYLPLGSCDVSTAIEFWSDVLPCRMKHCLGGEILVSLSYLPTAERLTVVIMKARNLKIPSANVQSVDPYARVVLILDGKRLKKKKTTSKRRDTNPVWNEALTFNVPADFLPKVTLEVSILDRDMLGHDEVIGSLSIGGQVTGSGREHWIDMGVNPRKTMAMWHPLVK